jgi:hypothetical protein
MRISDGVKKYQEDTKNRIFENIMAASSASEETQGYSSLKEKRDHRSDNTSAIGTGATNDKAVVKRDWTGLVAIAACAVLAVGVGTVMMKGIAPQHEIVNGTAATETESSDTAVTQTVTAQDPDQRSYVEDGFTFGDLLMESDEIVELKVQGHTLVKVADNTTGVRKDQSAWYAEYTAVYEYDTEKSGVIFKTSDDAVNRINGTHYLQYLGEADENINADLLTANNGDKVLVFVKKGVTEEDPKLDSAKSLTTADSIFRYDIANHRYVNIVSPGRYEDEVNEYVHDSLVKMSPSAVSRWAAYHRLSLVTIIESNENVPSGQIIDLKWDDDRYAYAMTVSR